MLQAICLLSPILHMYLNLLRDIFTLCFVLISCFLFAFLPDCFIPDCISFSASCWHIFSCVIFSCLCCFFLSLSLHPLDIVFFLLNMFCFPQHCYTYFYLSHWYSVHWFYLLSDVFLLSLSPFPISFHPQYHIRDNRGMTEGTQVASLLD